MDEMRYLEMAQHSARIVVKWRAFKRRLNPLTAWANERLDAPEDLEARERMLDGVERSYYKHR